MTKEDIIRSISEEFKISELESISFYENIFRYIESSFRKNRNLNITDFGKFNIIEKPGKTGEKMQHLKFSPAKKLATEINYNYSNLAKILFKDIEESLNRDRILKLGEEKPLEKYAMANSDTTNSGANSDNEGSGSDGNSGDNLSDVDEFLRNYTDQEKRFLQKQAVPVSEYSNEDLKNLDARIAKVENFIALIREYFEKEKTGDETITSFTGTSSISTDALLKAQAETYEKSLRKLEDKLKDLETKIHPVGDRHEEVKDEEKTDEKKVDSTETTKQAPVSEFKTSEPVIKIRPEHTKEIEDKILAPKEVKTEIEIQKVIEPESKPEVKIPEIPLADPSTRIASTETIEKISDKFTEAFPEKIKHPVPPGVEDLNKSAEVKGGDITKDFYTADKKAPDTDFDEGRQKPSGRNISSDNIADLLDNIKTPTYPETSSFDISHREVHAVEDEILKKEDERIHPEHKDPDESTDDILKKAFTEVQEVKPPEPSERAGEPSIDKKDGPIVDSQLETVKPKQSDQGEDERLSKALSSIYTSILESEKIQSDTTQPGPKTDEKLKDLHDEINKEAKPDDTYQQPRSFSDVFEDSVNKQSPDPENTNGKNLSEGTNGHNLKDTNGHNLTDTNGHNLKDTNGHNLTDTNGHNLKDTNGHNLKDTNGHNLKDTNGHGLKDTNGHGLKDTNGHGLKDTNGHGLKDTNGHGLKDTNGHGLAEGTNGHGLAENGNGNGNTLKQNMSATLKQNGTKINDALERNGLTTNKDSKLNAVVIVVIIIIAIALLAYGIFSAGIFGKSGSSQTLLKVNDPKTEKYYFDNGKDLVFFKTDKGFTIQVGSYKQKEKAIEKKNYFEKNNLEDVRIEEIMANNEVFYRVRIGKFESLDKAKNFSETL